MMLNGEMWTREDFTHDPTAVKWFDMAVEASAGAGSASAVMKREGEDEGGEDFFAWELALASALGIAAVNVADDIIDVVMKTIRGGGIDRFDDAMQQAANIARDTWDNTPRTQKRVEDVIRRALRSGAAVAGSPSLVDGVPRVADVLDGMVNSAKYFTNNYFNNQVMPRLYNIVERSLADPSVDTSALFRTVQDAMSQRLKSVPYWRVVANASASRAYHYGVVKAGMIAGFRQYTFDVVLDDRTSDICKNMVNRTFWLADAEVVANRVASAEEEEIKTTAPWLSTEESEASSAELADKGSILPPFHANCRTSIRLI